MAPLTMSMFSARAIEAMKSDEIAKKNRNMLFLNDSSKVSRNIPGLRRLNRLSPGKRTRAICASE